MSHKKPVVKCRADSECLGRVGFVSWTLQMQRCCCGTDATSPGWGQICTSHIEVLLSFCLCFKLCRSMSFGGIQWSSVSPCFLQEAHPWNRAAQHGPAQHSPHNSDHPGHLQHWDSNLSHTAGETARKKSQACFLAKCKEKGCSHSSWRPPKPKSYFLCSCSKKHISSAQQLCHLPRFS